MRFPTARLLVFAKAPIAGHSKRRLIPALGAEGAAELHARLVRRTLATATGAELCAVELWCASQPGHPFFSACRHDFPLTLKQQQGADLGQRMAHALRTTLAAQGGPVVLIGSDCPALTGADLAAALQALQDGNDCVLKPAEDGGYVLIGLSRFDDALFTGVHWGSATVMAETRARLDALGFRWQALATSWDLDRPADLERFQKLSDVAPLPYK